jgi:hypothetical protein
VQALIAEFDKSQSDFYQLYSTAKTDEDRQKLLQDKYPKPEKVSGELEQIAQDNPKTPAAFDALKWVMEHDRMPQGEQRKAALATLTRDFAADPRAGDIAMTMLWSSAPAEEAFCRAVVANNPDRTAKGVATYVLGRMAKERAQMARQLKSNPAMAANYEQYYGKDALAAMNGGDPDAATKEAEALFEQARKEYADVKGGMRETIGASAEAELFEMHNLAIGKVAPDIAGEDINGKPMKLSEFRGKVVTLDFWGDW